MWRPALRNVPRTWWRMTALGAAFALGVLFASYVMPFLSRDVGVWSIHGVKGRGCEGSWGATLIRFGQPRGQADGVYKIACDKFSIASETVVLHCECD